MGMSIISPGVRVIVEDQCIWMPHGSVERFIVKGEWRSTPDKGFSEGWFDLGWTAWKGKWHVE